MIINAYSANRCRNDGEFFFILW